MRIYRIGERQRALPAAILKIMSDGVERSSHQVVRLLGEQAKNLQRKWTTPVRYYVNQVMREMAERDQLRIVRRASQSYAGRWGRPRIAETPVYVIEQSRGELSSAALEQAWGRPLPQREAA